MVSSSERMENALVELNEHFDLRNALSLHFVFTLVEIQVASPAQKSEHMCHFSFEGRWKFEYFDPTDWPI